MTMMKQALQNSEKRVSKRNLEQLAIVPQVLKNLNPREV